MPKQRISKEMVVDAAFKLLRERGLEQITVRDVADALGCSVQPIYSYCENMDGLRREIERKAHDFVRGYLEAHIDPSDLFRSTGHAYVRLAQEEPHIFRAFLFQIREGVSSLDGLYHAETNPQIAAHIARDLKIDLKAAKEIHLNMLIYTIGIGVICAVSRPGIPEAEIFSQQESAYQALLGKALEECR